MILYCTPRDIRDFLLLRGFIDNNSAINSGQVENLIAEAMGEFERRTGEAHRPRFVANEILDMEAFKSRYPEIFETITVPRPFHLNHRPVVPFSASRGHKIEVYEGNEPWTDWLVKTQGRNADWWLNEEDGILYIRKAFVPRQHALVRVSYEYGFLPTTLTDNPLSASATTINVADASRYQIEGWVRIEEEYIYYTGKTATSFTGCTRGKFNSTAVQHSSGAQILQIPDAVRSLVIKRVAAKILLNERLIAEAAEGSGAAIAISKAVDDFNKEWEEALSGEFSRWEVF